MMPGRLADTVDDARRMAAEVAGDNDIQSVFQVLNEPRINGTPAELPELAGC